MVSKNRFQCGGNDGYESTGPYGEPMVHYLMKKPVMLVQVNPMHTKGIKEIKELCKGHFRFLQWYKRSRYYP